MNRSALRIAIALAASSAPAAFAQLIPGEATFPCHVVHVTNLTHYGVLVNVSVDPTGLVRVGAGWVDACTTGNIALAPTLRCGVTLNVRGEAKDASKVPAAMIKLNPAAAPTIAEAKGTVTPQNAAEPANWLALMDSGKGQVGWKPLPAGTKLAPGCPAAAGGAPGTFTFTFNNATGSPVLMSAGGDKGIVADKACIAAGQSRTWQVAASTGYKISAMSTRDPQCQQPAGPAIGFGAKPVNGVVTLNYVVAQYAIQQAGAAPAPSPTTQDTWTQTTNADPNLSTPINQGVPIGK